MTDALIKRENRNTRKMSCDNGGFVMHVQARKPKTAGNHQKAWKVSPGGAGRGGEGRGDPANILTSRDQKPERERTTTIIIN